MKKYMTLVIFIMLLVSGCSEKSNSTRIDENKLMTIKEYIAENVTISDDKCIEYEGWLDEEETCYRVAIEYKEEQEGEYSHSEDYFVFVLGNYIECVYVDYTKDKIGCDRYVWDACDFGAYLEDVTFDGELDLIISLGHAGAGGDLVYCAYVFEDGKYIYTNSFEKITNYKIDGENKYIVSMGDSERIFKYDGKEFAEQIYN